jgi:hypothetical protein
MKGECAGETVGRRLAHGGVSARSVLVASGRTSLGRSRVARRLSAGGPWSAAASSEEGVVARTRYKARTRPIVANKASRIKRRRIIISLP